MRRFKVTKSTIDGNGLFSTESIKKDSFVAYIHGPIHVFRTFTPEISEKMLDWIGVGRFSWIDTTNSPFRYINHSCEPNVAQISKRKVIAIKDISEGEELTMDYSLTEAEPGWGFPCNCKTKTCRKNIGPIFDLPIAHVRKMKPYIPKPFLKIYEIETGHKI
ncbi:MAG: SET domain-containing protein-lysine N-methyltransferase [Patescibacteria group bacterium]